jgi:hypothetical protein
MICLQHHEHELHFLDSLGEKNDATFPKHQFLAQSNGLPSTTIIITFYRLICNIISVVSRRRNKRTDYSRPVTYGCCGQQYLNILTGATAYPCWAPEFTPQFFFVVIYFIQFSVLHQVGFGHVICPIH